MSQYLRRASKLGHALLLGLERTQLERSVMSSATHLKRQLFTIFEATSASDRKTGPQSSAELNNYDVVLSTGIGNFKTNDGQASKRERSLFVKVKEKRKKRRDAVSISSAVWKASGVRWSWYLPYKGERTEVLSEQPVHACCRRQHTAG